MQSYYLNAFLGAGIVSVFIFVDYIRKYNTDAFQRGLFLAVLAATLAAIVFDCGNRVFAGVPGPAARIGLYLTISVFLVAQNSAFYLIFVFIDYFAYKSAERTKKILGFLAVLMALYIAAVLVNLPLRYFFYISEDNYYTPAKLYLLRLGISYFPLVLSFFEIFIAAGQFKHSQIVSIVFFGILTGTGAGLDIMLKNSCLIWPCFTASLLYFYFFIVQSDSKLDSLTGLGNRFSFNEFIERLSRAGTKESYSIVMIDMDHFKAINDTLGHLEGDNALRDMALVIKSCIRGTDVAARYGGDEFIIAVKSEYNIEKLMERIQQAIDHQNEKGKRPYKIQMSYGWDVFTAGSSSEPAPIESFLDHVDKLMYKNKAAKKG
ncbi:MAG: GGDEF domain-containing protein, partial [Treponema sp.]|nr:GGDEF domain-containing protein [Treponema sp.]